MVNKPLLAIVVRVFIALVTCTVFQPDEYFQSLEVAHHAVFGYGHLTWEWLVPKPIRSIIYPGLTMPVYWLLKVFKLDHTVALIWGPKVLHGVIAAGTDIWLMRLTRRTAGEKYVEAAFYLSLTSMFHAMSLSRSMSNSAETTLTTMALSYFPWNVSAPSWKKELWTSLGLAAIACAIRPTNLIIWVYMFAWLLWQLRQRPQHIRLVLFNASAIGAAALSAIYALDSYYYGKPTFTPLNFLLTNASSVSLFYGRSRWHYYLSQALGVVLFPAYWWFISGVITALKSTSPRPYQVLFEVIVWTMSVYSLPGHKEWRFIHPLLPLMHVIASHPLVEQYYQTSEYVRNNRPLQMDRDQYLQRSQMQTTHHPPPPVHYLVGRLRLALFVAFSIFAVRFIQPGQIAVMHYLRRLPAEQSTSVGFLMPCHSTPWQAYLHRPNLSSDGRLWALGCEPPLQYVRDTSEMGSWANRILRRGQSVSEYRDQTDIFYGSPIRYLTERFPERVDPSFPPSPFPRSEPAVATKELYPWRHEWPQNLVFFGDLLKENGVEQLFQDLGYEEVWKTKGGLLSDDRRGGGVHVWRYVTEVVP